MVDKPEESDVIIVNTCGFLDTAREESVDTILECGEIKKRRGVEKLLVMGCFSERYGSDLVKEMPEVDKFFGTNDHSVVLSYLTGKKYKNEEEVKLENPDPKDIKRDVKMIIPKGFDVFGEKPLK